MSAVLRFVLLRLAHWHMVASLLVVIFTLSPEATWACTGKHDIFCAGRDSVWKLQHVFPETLAYVIQGFLLLTAAVNFSSVILGFAHVYKEVVAILDALTFAFGIIPWAITLGYRNEAHGKTGSAMVIAMIATFIQMVAASLALTAILMPDDARREKALMNSKDSEAQSLPLLESEPRPEKKDDLSGVLGWLDNIAIFAVFFASASVVELQENKDMQDIELGGLGCQIAVLLLAADVALLTGLIRRQIIDVNMGAIVASSLALVGWITGIVGCSLVFAAEGSMTTPVLLSLISLILFVVVFSLGLYVGIKA